METNKKDKKLCQICGEIANNLCFESVMYLCDTCFKYIHDKNINKNHKREKVDYFVPFSLKCPDHPKDRINLFCIDENGKNIFSFIYFL